MKATGVVSVTNGERAQAPALPLSSVEPQTAQHRLRLTDKRFLVETYGEISPDAFAVAIGGEPRIILFAQHHGLVHAINTIERTAVPIYYYWTAAEQCGSWLVLLGSGDVLALGGEGYQLIKFPPGWYDAGLLVTEPNVVKIQFGHGQTLSWAIPSRDHEMSLYSWQQ